MARYFFDIRDGMRHHFRDYLGVELPSMEDARRVAVELAEDLSAAIGNGWQSGTIEIWSDKVLLEVFQIELAGSLGSPTRH